MKNKNEERLELYKMYVDTSLKVSENRLKVNNFFITINLTIIGSNEFINSFSLLLFGVVINYLWLNLLESCDSLNKAKFKIIHEMEEYFCHKCFKKEEEIYKNDDRKSFVTIEKLLPILIILLYLYMIIQLEWEYIIKIFK